MTLTRLGPFTSGQTDITWIIHDITRLKLAEEALRQSEARFRSLVAHSSDLITVLDADGLVPYQSPSIERLLGYRVDEVEGTRFDRLLSESDRPLLAQLIAVDGSGDPDAHTIECSVLHRDGTQLTFEVQHTDLLHDEHVHGIVLNSRDVSERKAFEEQLRATPNDAQRHVVLGLGDEPEHRYCRDECRHGSGRYRDSQAHSEHTSWVDPDHARDGRLRNSFTFLKRCLTSAEASAPAPRLATRGRDERTCCGARDRPGRRAFRPGDERTSGTPFAAA
mgnify:CR=1 FL=1